MKLLDRYDWIVLGDSPGALLSGWMAAKLGLSVLFLELMPRLKPRVSTSGQYWDPEPNFFLGWNEAGSSMPPSPFSTLLASGSRVRAIVPDPGFEVALPGVRMDVGTDFARLTRETQREFGAGRPAIRSWLESLGTVMKKTSAAWSEYPLALTQPTAVQGKKMPKRVTPILPGSSSFRRQLWRMPSAKEVKAWEATPELRQLVEGWRVGMGLPTGCADIAEAMEGLGIAPWAFRFHGGMSEFRTMIREAASTAGAHDPSDGECKRIFITEGRAVGVQVANRAAAVSAGGMILGCALEHARSWMNFDTPRSGKRLKDAPSPCGWRFTLAVTVRSTAVIAGMKDRIIWTEAGAPALEIEILDPVERGQNEPDQKVILLRAILDFRAETLSPEYQRMMASRMFRQLLELFPYLEFHVVRVFPDFRKPDLEDWVSLYDFESLREIPANLRVFAQSEAEQTTGIEGLFLGTEEAGPGWGSFSQLRAAMEAVAWAAHRGGLPGPLPSSDLKRN